MIYVVTAYAVTVLLIGGYAWSVRRRTREAERELASIRGMSGEAEGRPGDA